MKRKSFRESTPRTREDKLRRAFNYRRINVEKIERQLKKMSGLN
jgi:hypothetical protein